jgi:hypothetical protein
MQRFDLVNQTARPAQRRSVSGRRRQRGIAMVLFSVGLVVIMAMAGLALDMGHAYVNKTRLQNAIDAAALSGASALYATWVEYNLHQTDRDYKEITEIAESAIANAKERAIETFVLNFNDSDIAKFDLEKFIFEFYTSLSHFEDFEFVKENQLQRTITRMQREGITPSDCANQNLNTGRPSLCNGFYDIMNQYYTGVNNTGVNKYPTYVRVTTGSSPLIQQNWLIQVLPGVGDTLAVGASAIAGFGDDTRVEEIELETIFPIAFCENPYSAPHNHEIGDVYSIDINNPVGLAFIERNSVSVISAFADGISYSRDTRHQIVFAEQPVDPTEPPVDLTDARSGFNTRFGQYADAGKTYTVSSGEYTFNHSADYYTVIDVDDTDVDHTKYDEQKQICEDQYKAYHNPEDYLDKDYLDKYVEAGCLNPDPKKGDIEYRRSSDAAIVGQVDREADRRIIKLSIANCDGAETESVIHEDTEFVCMFLRSDLETTDDPIAAEFIDESHCPPPLETPAQADVVLYPDRLSRSGI